MPTVEDLEKKLAQRPEAKQLVEKNILKGTVDWQLCN